MGGNLIRRDLGPELMHRVSIQLHNIIVYSLENREDALAYAMQFARDMPTELADRFVAMWVNDLTLDYGERGREAVRRLLDDGHAAGIIPHKVEVDFVE
jgi:1,4-dihydroxy-6-naphthoate synthase